MKPETNPDTADILKARFDALPLEQRVAIVARPNLACLFEFKCQSTQHVFHAAFMRAKDYGILDKLQEEMDKYSAQSIECNSDAEVCDE